jgi:hypothetical protein
MGRVFGLTLVLGMLAAATCGVAMRLRQTSKVKIAPLTGGDPPKSGRGEAFAPHGYFGVETQVVDTIARFINANTAHQP